MMRLSPIASLLYLVGYGPAQVAVAFAQTRHFLSYNVPLTVASEFPRHNVSPRYMQPPTTPYVNYAQQYLPRGPARHEFAKEKRSSYRKTPSTRQHTWYTGGIEVSYQGKGRNGKMIVQDGKNTVSFGLESKVNAASKARKVLIESGLGRNKGLVKKVERIAARLEQ